ncbi:hypothetical protein AGMMS50256_34010 [Betaproteobacteria bacterium]|nr:hypothetical protein AGMMS50256_34010 [Betaproteobacteria bacterium]
MIIASSSLQLEAKHSQQQYREVTESLRGWVGDCRPDFEGREGRGAEALPSAKSDLVSLSNAGRAAQAEESASLGKAPGAEDSRLLMIRILLSKLTGKEFKVFDAGQLKAPGEPTPASTPAPAWPSNAGYGVEYERHETYAESEQTLFSASGVVHTADGKSIDFNLSLSMSRSYYMESDISLRLGDAATPAHATTDPLVINFSGNAAQLTDQRFAFDLDADGTASEQINFLAGGSGFLSFDRNADGVINDGSELFGALTGNGFAELAALDDDHNGWIDENDAAYAQLSLWTRDSAGADILRSLKEADVGAISLVSVATPFAIKDENNNLQGLVRSSGVFLQESGGIGSIQQIDLTV